MKFSEQIREGLRNLYYSKLRTALALLGVLVGTASVVAMVLGGELATNEALKQFKTLGTDLLALSINTSVQDDVNVPAKSTALNLSDVFHARAVNADILQIAPYTQLFYPSYFEDQALNATILGVTNDFAKTLNIGLQRGRFISIADHYAYYAVIGQHIYEEIRKVTRRDVIGQSIQIGKNLFVIVGVATSWPENNFIYTNIDSSIMVPIEASLTLSQYATIDNMVMKIKPDADINHITQNLREYFQRMLSDKQYNFRSAKELIKKMRQQSDILTVFLGLVGGVSLMVGGIGVMNIMLVSVIERRREIGIRLAIGARQRDIAILFLSEAIVLSVLGGMLGIIIGVLIAYVIALIWHWEFILFIWPPVIGFTVSVIVGILSGFYPAYLAAKLQPMETLRM